jgi:hypothetical protein
MVTTHAGHTQPVRPRALVPSYSTHPSASRSPDEPPLVFPHSTQRTIIRDGRLPHARERSLAF